MDICRRLFGKDVENVEKKDSKLRIESSIELQSSPEPEKDSHTRVIFVSLIGSFRKK